MSDKDLFAQVDANLDTNPKIRKAGSLGRQVFEFLLRRNALRGFTGELPASFVDPEYLAELLMIHESDAVTGVTKAVTAKLIAIDEVAGVVRIVGWTTDWGRRPKDGKERTQAWRDRKNGKSQEPVTTGDACDDPPSQVTAGDESDAIRVQRESRDLGDTHSRVRARHPAAGGIARSIWNLAAKKRDELAAANVPVPRWHGGLMPDAAHPGWSALLDRVGEQLVNATAEEAEAVCRNRVEVAAAKALATGEGQWFASTAMFTPNSFAHWSGLDPAQVARKAAKPARKPNGVIGAGTPRTDHGTESRPAREVL